MRLVSFKLVGKGALIGFANIELPNGLKISDCPVLTSHGKAWATLPSKPVLDRDGKQIVVDGKRQYCSLLEWNSRDLSERFSQTLIELVRAKHPEALDDDAGKLL